MKHLTITLLTLLMSMGAWAEFDVICEEKEEKTNKVVSSYYFPKVGKKGMYKDFKDASRNSEFYISESDPLYIGLEYTRAVGRIWGIVWDDGTESKFIFNLKRMKLDIDLESYDNMLYVCRWP